MSIPNRVLFVALAALLTVLAPLAEATDLPGHWVSVGITEPSGEETKEYFDGFPVRLCVHYQLNSNGSFEAVIFGAWFAGTWTKSGDDTALLEVKEKAETNEFLPEKLTVKEGQIVYTDSEGLRFRLAPVEGKLDVDALLEEIQAELE